VDIVFTVDGICILADIFIINLIHVDLISQAASSWGMVMMVTSQTKVVSYCDQHHEDDFIPLKVEILDVYTNKQMTSFTNVLTFMVSEGFWRSSSFDYTFTL